MKRQSKNGFILAGDIGGTKTRLGLFSVAKPRPRLNSSKIYSSLEAEDFEDLLEHFVKHQDVPVSSVCLAVAGPVENGRFQATNLPWIISEDNLRESSRRKPGPQPFPNSHRCLTNEADFRYAFPSPPGYR